MRSASVPGSTLRHRQAREPFRPYELEAATLCVSLGLTNFEESTYSTMESFLVWDHLGALSLRKGQKGKAKGKGKDKGKKGKPRRVNPKDMCKPGIMTPGHHNYDRELSERFYASLQINFPEICDGRNIAIIDATEIDDPDHDLELRNHTGRHHMTLERVLNNENLLRVNHPLRGLSSNRKNLVVNICRSGRHRSVALNVLQPEVICHNLYDNNDMKVCTIDLHEKSDWGHLCPRGCLECSHKHPAKNDILRRAFNVL